MSEEKKTGFTITCRKCGNEYIYGDYEDPNYKGGEIHITGGDGNSVYMYCDCGNET